MTRGTEVGGALHEDIIVSSPLKNAIVALKMPRPLVANHPGLVQHDQPIVGILRHPFEEVALHKVCSSRSEAQP
jgi:hypothetical protein